MADRLTDKELREQLIAFGESNIGPITETTRALYIKKLNHYNARQNKVTKSTSRRTVSKKLIGFSSDESDNEAGTSTAPPAASGRRRGPRGRVVKEEPKPRAPIPTYDPPAARRRSTGLRRRPVKAPEPEEEEEEDDQTDFSMLASQSTTYESPARNMQSFNMQTSFNNTYHFDAAGDYDTSPKMSPREEGFDSSDPESDFDPRRDDDDDESNGKESASWGLFGSGSTKSKDQGQSRSAAYQSNSVNISKGGTKTSTYQNTRRKEPVEDEEVIRNSGFKTKEDPPSRYKQYISTFLVVLAFMFFIALGFMYLTMNSGDLPDDEAQPNFMLLPDSTERKSIGTTEVLFEKSQVKAALPLVQAISEILRSHAGNSMCGWENDGPVLAYDVLRDRLEEKDETYVWTGFMSTTMETAAVLIANNDHWKIKMYDKESAELNEVIKAADTKTLSNVLRRVDSLESKLPLMSLTCRLYKSLSRVLNFIFFLISAALVVTVAISIVRWRKRRAEEEKQAIYDLVEKIINILKSHHDMCQASKEQDMPQYLAIPHVRDMLIPPQDRRAKQGVWDKAVRFLSANESRVRQETQKIAGEEFMVWRWLQATYSNGGKVWQGQACGEKESSMIVPNKNYTPCLKVRNMFDIDIEFGDSWHVKIQDAIIEKCGPNHGIVHIAVDKKSKEGCVYVKCKSTEDAGQAFRSLQAWWFDGKLVTVKFLRLERYHERFPDSISLNSPLKASDNSCHSLSQPFHKSIIESS